jgi:hypothetical protein
MSASANAKIAKAIIPNAQQSGPLTADDLAPRTSVHTFAEGIDLTHTAEIYLGALAGKESNAIPTLAKAVESSSSRSLIRDIRILIDLDAKVHLKLGFKTYQKYYEHVTGRKISRSTVWRRRLRAEFALLLGARGRPDLLPSQRQSELLRKNLAREPSVLFLLSVGDPAVLHRMGQTKFLEELEIYRVQNKLRPVGECVDDSSGPSKAHENGAKKDADISLIQEIAGLLRVGIEGSTAKPLSTAVAIYNQLQQASSEVLEHGAIASKIADVVSKRANGITVLAARSCLIRLISDSLARSAADR